tara:strand:+ start:305 stop:1144 length:840 start_codon:yes stop_codon:yes gene_type:complete
MNKYENIASLYKLENFIEEGGNRLTHNEKDNFPFLTIITVVKNSSNSIESTIKSVISQKYKNYEYIVIDGNSTDGTLEKIKSYEKEINYWCSINDKGIYDAMNYGLKLARGDVIGIINSGDLFTENSFKIVNQYFENNENISYLFGTVERHYLGNNIILKSGYDKKRIKYNFDAQTCHSSGFFIKSSVQKTIGLYNLKYKCSSDYNLFYKLFDNENFIGKSTAKDEIIGIVEPGGFSSKYGYWNRLKEEMQIRIDNEQNSLLVLLIFINSIFKNFIKKL